MNRLAFQIRSGFRRAIRQAAIVDGATVLVAVSGGCDSLYLLHLVRGERRQRGWRVWVAHVDHGLRPDSAEDARWVRALAREWRLPSIGVRVDPRVWSSTRSIEDRARTFRHRALRQMARRIDASEILLGHNRDDQAETLLIHLLRGSGLRGLGGMDPVSRRNPRLIRPLLDIGRDDLRRAARDSGLSWREDPSNADPRFLRNRIRGQLLPLLEADYRPGAGRVLARTAGSLRPARAWLQAEVDRGWRELDPVTEVGSIRLDRSHLASYHPVLIEGVIRRAFSLLAGSARDLGSAHIQAVSRAIGEPRAREFRLPRGIAVRVNGNRFEMVLPIAPPFEALGASNES